MPDKKKITGTEFLFPVRITGTTHRRITAETIDQARKEIIEKINLDNQYSADYLADFTAECLEPELTLKPEDRAAWPFWGYGWHGNDGIDWRSYQTDGGPTSIPDIAEESWPIPPYGKKAGQFTQQASQAMDKNNSEEAASVDMASPSSSQNNKEDKTMNDTRKAVIITAGPTNERIDAVMQITNMSTGKLGAMIAETMLNADGKHAGTAEQIRKIYYFSNKLSRKPIVPDGQADKLQLIETTDADDMLTKLIHVLTSDEIDLMVHTAAVGDYKARYSARAEDIAEEIAKQIASMPNNAMAGDGTAHIATIRAVALGVLKNPAGKANDDTKMSSHEPNLMTVMDLTPKIISRIKDISPATMLIGCKLLEGVDKPHLFRVASELRQNTRADYIIANDLAKIGNGRHPAMIIGYDHAMDRDAIFTECKSKQEIANAICLLAFQNADAKFVPHTMNDAVWQVIAANNMNTDIRVEGFSASRQAAWGIMVNAFLETMGEMMPDVKIDKGTVVTNGCYEFDDEFRRASINSDGASVYDGEDMWYYNLVPIQEKAVPDTGSVNAGEDENSGIL